MSRSRLSALSLWALLAATASAGELRIHRWPSHFLPVELMHIRVVMDVGYWIDFVNPPHTIKLEPVDLRTYEGRADLQVVCNFNLSMRCTIAPTGAVPGRYSCWIEGGDINAPGGTARLFVRLEHADVAAQWGGSKNVHVATVAVRITPRV
jgi:hypothetical protein